MMSKTETMIDSRTASTRWRLVAALAMIALAAATGGRADDPGQTEKEEKMTKTESGLQYREVRGAWLAAGQRDVHRADAIAAERAEKPRRGARSPAVGQPGRGDSPGRSGSVLRC